MGYTCVRVIFVYGGLSLGWVGHAQGIMYLLQDGIATSTTKPPIEISSSTHLTRKVTWNLLTYCMHTMVIIHVCYSPRKVTLPLETSGCIVIASLALSLVITQHPTSLQRQRDLVEGNNLHTTCTQPPPWALWQYCMPKCNACWWCCLASTVVVLRTWSDEHL